ncbi:MAG: GNAT family N-acetyltransferase [Sphingomicrobium sp.]
MEKTQRSAPTLETERLLLRAFRKEDFRPYHAILAEPAVHEHFGPDPMGQEECWRRIAASLGMWQLVGFGGWAVVRKSDNRLIGTVALFNAWREFEPKFGDDPEMGWIFATEVHGQGLAGEACRTALDWADLNLPDKAIWAIISPANDPSIRLAGKLGFSLQGETEYHEEPTLVLKRAPRD